MIEKEKRQSTISTSTLGMGIVASIISTIIVIITLNFGKQDSTFEWAWVTGPFFILFLVMVIHRLWAFVAGKFKLGQQQSVTIYSMIMISSTFAIIPYFLIPWLSYLIHETTYRATVLGGATAPYMPSLWMIKDPSILEGAFVGGAAVPWADWLIPLSYWMVLFLSLGLCQIFINIIWRKQFIEVERLPFPYADAANEILTAGDVKGVEPTGKLFGLSPFWIGALVGFVLMIYPMLTSWVPGLANIPPIYDNLLWGVDLSSKIGNNIVLRLNLNPIWIALALLIPLDILLSAWLWFLIAYIIIPVIQIQIGTQFVRSEQFDFGNFVDVNHFAGRGFMPGWLMWGAMLGLPIWMLFFNRGYIIGTIRQAFSGGDGESNLYRWSYIGMIVTFAIVVALLAVAGVAILMSLFIPLWALLIYWTWTRVRATGGGYTCFWFYGPWYQDAAAPIPWIPYSVAGTYNSAACFTSTSISMMLMCDRNLGGTAQPSSMDSFKLADTANIKPKSMVLPQIIALVIGVLISFPVSIWGAYTYGWDASTHAWQGHPNRSMWAGWFEAFIGGTNTLVPANWASWLGTFIIGTVFVGVLIFLRMQFVWWPIEPIGVILAGSTVTGWFMFIPLIIAWATKMTVLRVGGTRLYEKVVLPFAVGLFVMGFLLLYFKEIGVA